METTMMRDHGLNYYPPVFRGFHTTLKRRLEEYNDSNLDSESDSDDAIVRTDNSMSTITSYHINDEDTNHDRGTRVVVATTKYG